MHKRVIGLKLKQFASAIEFSLEITKHFTKNDKKGRGDNAEV